jgi:hypothetical protein
VVKLARPLSDLPTANTAARIRAAAAAHKELHRKLVAVLRILVRPVGHGETRWSELRRVLQLAGLRRYKVARHAVIAALLEVVPDAYTARGGLHKCGPRVIRGIRLHMQMDRLRALLTADWEKRIDPPVERIALEYRLGPDAADGRRRINEMVAAVHNRREANGPYFAAAIDYLHTNGWSRYPGHKQVWQLHCEGATRAEIVEATGLKGWRVQSILDLHRARKGLTR